jgi:hypothetical protein
LLLVHGGEVGRRLDLTLDECQRRVLALRLRNGRMPLLGGRLRLTFNYRLFSDGQVGRHVFPVSVPVRFAGR